MNCHAQLRYLTADLTARRNLTLKIQIIYALPKFARKPAIGKLSDPINEPASDLESVNSFSKQFVHVLCIAFSAKVRLARKSKGQ